nr:hypothetical protein [uncultured Bacillus sp.]
MNAKENIFFHPNLAMVRAKRMLNGQVDPLITAAGLKEGMSFLDCTLGLAFSFLNIIRIVIRLLIKINGKKLAAPLMAVFFFTAIFLYKIIEKDVPVNNKVTQGHLSINSIFFILNIFNTSNTMLSKRKCYHEAMFLIPKQTVYTGPIQNLKPRILTHD